MELKIFVLKL